MLSKIALSSCLVLALSGCAAEAAAADVESDGVALLAEQAAPAAADPTKTMRRTPVVFVHGVNANAATWVVGIFALRAAGYRADELFAIDYDFRQPVEQSARQLATFIDDVRRKTGAQQVDVVNHSLGGLVTLYYANALGGAPSLRRVASMAGAHHGTDWGISECGPDPVCADLRPDSAVVQRATAGDETPAPTRWATWYSPCDRAVRPYTSTVLKGAENHLVLCQDHALFLIDLVVYSQITRFLKS